MPNQPTTWALGELGAEGVFDRQPMIASLIPSSNGEQATDSCLALSVAFVGGVGLMVGEDGHLLLCDAAFSCIMHR